MSSGINSDDKNKVADYLSPPFAKKNFHETDPITRVDNITANIHVRD